VLWLVLSVPPPRAKWLRIELPDHAVIGAELPVQITLQPNDPVFQQEGLHFIVDLQWTTTHREGRGYLGPVHRVHDAPPGSPMEYSGPIPAREELGFVHIVAYLSPTGNWPGHVVAAETPPLPVRVAVAGAESVPVSLQEVPVFESTRDPGRIVTGPQPIRVLLAVGWLGFAVVWIRRCRHDVPRWLSTLALVAGLAAAWELLPVEAALGADARALARARHWYDLRVALQRPLTIAIVVGAIALLLRAWPAASLRRARLVVLGLVLHGSVTLAAFLRVPRSTATAPPPHAVRADGAAD
jgi:hypothetical protein